jgi:predicted DNA-binding transcriptional regulator AlpA
MDNKLWTTNEIMKLTGLKKPTVMGLVNEKSFPDPCFTLGQRLRVWRKGDVIRWWGKRKAARKRNAA